MARLTSTQGPNTPNDPSPYQRAPKPSIIAWLRDRRVIAVAETDGVVTTGSSVAGACFAIALNATLVDLRQVEWVIDINLFTDPAANLCLGSPYNKKITGNIVGFTVVGTSGLTTGTTVFAEVVAIGPP